MNYYGLSALNDQEYNLKLAFPYNELLWFIKGLSIKEIKGCQVSVQRIVMVYPSFFSLSTKKSLGFRTTNCYGLSQQKTKVVAEIILFPYNELLWFIFALASL